MIENHKKEHGIAICRYKYTLLCHLQKKTGYSERTEIDVRRSCILTQALKNGHKWRFDPTKLLKEF